MDTKKNSEKGQNGTHAPITWKKFVKCFGWIYRLIFKRCSNVQCYQHKKGRQGTREVACKKITNIRKVSAFMEAEYTVPWKSIHPFVHLCSKLNIFKCAGNYQENAKFKIFWSISTWINGKFIWKKICSKIFILMDSRGSQS